MPKKPKQLPPEPGDRVKLRGREPHGYLLAITNGGLWAHVWWDVHRAGPKIVGSMEIEKVVDTQFDA